MAALAAARLLLATLPLKSWRQTLGLADGRASQAQAILWASHVDWAARRLPFFTKCLPRAMALSWILRRRRIGHAIVFAVRPPGLRDSGDALHAWVETGGKTIIGDLPGPWVETLRLGATAAE